MSTYKITFFNGDIEEAEATSVEDHGEWTDFSDGNGLVLRVQSKAIKRVDRVTSPTAS